MTTAHTLLRPGGAEWPAMPHEVQPFHRRLAAFATLSGPELSMVAELARQPAREVAARTQIHAEGEGPPPAVLLSGWGCRTRLLSDGRRQIVSFLLPGDLLGGLPPQLPTPCAAMALSPVRLADATAALQAVRAAPAAHPGLSRALFLFTQAYEVLLRDQIVRLGRQTAFERMASLMLEFMDRLELAGLVRDGSFAMPLTQETLGDALGLSGVHVNRTLQQLRRDELIDLRGGIVTIHKLKELREIADWQPPPRPLE
jgi:CRP-like cAMP-binding protein